MRVSTKLKFMALLLTSSFQLSAAQITWSYQNISFTGERSNVLEFTNSLAEIFATDSGERLIHALKEYRPQFKLMGGEGSYKIAVDDLHITGSSGGLEEIYQVVLTQYEKYEGLIPAQIEYSLFRDELELLEDKESIFDDYISVTSKSESNLKRMLSALREIKHSKVGRTLFIDMKSCQKSLLINDDKSSLSGGGYTGALGATTAVFDGRGADARIRFRFDQPELGSHLVWSAKRKQIPFTYIENLFHELVHAKHTMCGTLSRIASEHQAIEEENHFRRERQGAESDWERDPSRYEDGEQVWFGLFLGP